MNKYERVPDKVIDLHGFTKAEAKEVLEKLLYGKQYCHVRLITGKGLYRGSGPVLGNYVQSLLRDHGISFEYAKLYNGGQGALEVYFSKN